MKNIRLRFAPSPTGALHIGGIRTALYNYLLAKKHDGEFILRIEDTDQNRYVPGAEEYIVEALEWCGLKPAEGPGYGGAYGPYRQSERMEIYRKYAEQLVDSGHAYYAFDTEEELKARREEAMAKGSHNFKYDAATRQEMKNSLTLPEEVVKQRLDKGEAYTIRLKVPAGDLVTISDLVRGEVSFRTEELDDKVILKSDGMPTYHLANIVDDYLMKITHVIRGEEWLPSTGHHLLLYRFLGWENNMPQFAHLPLILKPNGKGKLSKRDGQKLGIPVFPLAWDGAGSEAPSTGFREFGFLPEAVVNFLAFLGWNPGTEQEIFSLDELSEAFSIDNIGKSGARFDFDKAKWYNQQYIIAADSAYLAKLVRPIIESEGHQPDEVFLQGFCELMKERVTLLPEFWEKGHYFFEAVDTYDNKIIQKRWHPERRQMFHQLTGMLEGVSPFETAAIKETVEGFIHDNGLKFGEVFPILRVALTGATQGPAVFEMMALLGKAEVLERLENAYVQFDKIVVSTRT